MPPQASVPPEASVLPGCASDRVQGRTHGRRPSPHDSGGERLAISPATDLPCDPEISCACDVSATHLVLQRHTAQHVARQVERSSLCQGRCTAFGPAWVPSACECRSLAAHVGMPGAAPCGCCGRRGKGVLQQRY